MFRKGFQLAKFFRPILKYATALLYAFNNRLLRSIRQVHLYLQRKKLNLAVDLPDRQLFRSIVRIVSAQSYLSRFIPQNSRKQALRAHMYSVIFSEPMDVATNIVRLEAIHSCFIEKQKKFIRRENYFELGHFREMLWPEEGAYRDSLCADNRSRILVSIHMGNYWQGYLRLGAANIQNGRRNISLRKALPSVYEQEVFRNFEKLGVVTEFIRHDTDNPIKILSALRRGNTTLTCQFDLTQNFGKTVAVEFFGRKAFFVRGVAELAIASKIPIIPFVTYYEHGFHHIEMAAPVETELFHGESLQEGTQRVTQQLARLAERWIRFRPYQWQFLYQMDSYFQDPEVHIRLS